MRYRITGSLYDGVPWEDFFTGNGDPIVCMEANPGQVPAGKRYVIAPAEDGCIDVFVPVLTKDIAREVLAEINGLTPSQIEIDEDNFAPSA